MLAVALLRNLNQGQRAQPTTAQLVAAFTDAGATDVRTVRGNGTVIVHTDDAAALATRVREALEASSGWSDEIVVISADFIGSIAETWGDAQRHELTVWSSEAAAEPAAHPSRRCTIVAGGPGWAVTVNDRDRESNATPLIERLLGVRATSRGLGTIALVAARL